MSQITLNALVGYFYGNIGNVLKNAVNGQATIFTFDAANQLVSSTCDGVTTRYAYDAAGRMIKEGDKTYTYGYLDKVMAVTENDRTITYAYHPDGQLASANYGDRSESFAWDGLALIRRGDEQFVNDPHVGGGNPVASSKGTTYFNDLLGTTVGAKSGATYTAAALSAFGEDLNHHSPTPTSNSHSFYTGKPAVEGLGYAFLMRNYRAGLAKWQTADPMGYPDGWNQLAYCGNGVTGAVDLWGCELVVLGEVFWNSFHIASVWANCNHEYESPSFDITKGKLEQDPKQSSSIVGCPNFTYDTIPAINGLNYNVNVSFEQKPMVEMDYDTDPLNLMVRWEYQIKLTITATWQESQEVPDPVDPTKTFIVTVPKSRTYIERQDAVKGTHYVAE